MDISTIIIKPDFLEIYYAEMLEFEYDVTVYELKKYSNSKDNPFLESWFLKAIKSLNFLRKVKKKKIGLVVVFLFVKKIFLNI